MTPQPSPGAKDPVKSSAFILFSYGFRPFFLFGALYAALLILIWVPWFLGAISLPTQFPPTAWHAHELLFGYVAAAIAGFLLTAVANWTSRPPASGPLLAGLFALWIAGRISVAFSGVIGLIPVALICIAFPLCLAIVVGREIIAGGNMRNLKILGLLLGFAAAQGLFHWEVLHHGRLVLADRLAIAAVIVLIMLIGGRIIPIFTGNWLKAHGDEKIPPRFNRFDTATMGVSVAALAAWAVSQGTFLKGLEGALLAGAAFINLARQARWCPHRIGKEPLVAILHGAYLFVPVGFALAAIGVFLEDRSATAAATHAWTTGAIAAMTLGVMTRASLGHTGRALTASPATVFIYAAVLLAAAARILAALQPQWTMTLMPLAGVSWIAAFGGFAAVYGPKLLRPRLPKD
ncbi:MAG: NnrS family protein [Pseudomonadota bacterium]